jgi:hypothetical protein
MQCRASEAIPILSVGLALVYSVKRPGKVTLGLCFSMDDRVRPDHDALRK